MVFRGCCYGFADVCKKEELNDNGYEDAHKDDAIVLRSTSNKIGLIHHGPMKYVTANWSKAKRKKTA